MTQVLVQLTNNAQYLIELNDTNTAKNLAGMLKHLQHTSLVFKNFDNPHKCKDGAIEQLLEYSNKLNITVDTAKLSSQEYLNELHKIYEDSYDGDITWLMYHEAIHMVETLYQDISIPTAAHLSYREKSGLLKKPYKFEDLETCRATFNAGDCYVEFSELGKMPFVYWYNGEPDSLERLCQLSKPWLNMQCKICVALDNMNRLPPQDQIDKFEQWFAKYHDDWCKHWNIPYWTITQAMGGILVGKINNVQAFSDDLKNGHTPVKLTLV